VSFGRQLGLLARRSILRTLRDPGNIVPPLVLPLVLFAVLTAGLSSATKVPGFPTDSFATFALAIAFIQGAVMAVATTGSAIASDIESGFISRLALTPMRTAALLCAQLAGVFVLAFGQAAVYLGVGFAADAHVEAGVPGVAVLVALFLLCVLGFGAFGIFIGLVTASGQAVAGIAPVMTVFLFMSSMSFPRNLISTDWFRAIATGNPVSYLIEGMRSLLIVGWDRQALALGFGVAVAFIVLMLVIAAAGLGRRLASA
jgi:ABC-2 type transport system permease protein